MPNNWDVGSGFTNNGSVGFGGSINGVTQGIYEESSTQLAPLGALIDFDDGRRFRYTKSAAGITIGNLCSHDYSDGLLAELDSTTGVSATAGNREFAITGSGSQLSSTSGIYAGSYIVFTDGTGAGQYYRIKDHTDASSDKITFQLYDKLITAPVAATGIMIVGGRYGAVITNDRTANSGAGAADDDMRPMGVNLIAITSGYYFWMQTRGICSVQADLGDTAAPAYGMEMVASGNHAGLVEMKLDADDGHPVVGVNASPTGDDNEYIAIDLMLE